MLQKIYFEEKFLICVFRDGDTHVDDGCSRRSIGDNLKILMTDLKHQRHVVTKGHQQNDYVTNISDRSTS